MSTPFAPSEAPAIISLLLDAPDLASAKPDLFRWKQWLTMTTPDLFQDLNCHYVAAEFLNYWEEFKIPISRQLLWSRICKRLTADSDYEDIQKIIFRPTDWREAPILAKVYTEWCKHQALGHLFSDEAQEAYTRGDYAFFDKIHERYKTLEKPESDMYGFKTATAFMAEEYHETFLIDGILEANQPMMIGGKDKCLKTGLVADLVISLATGTTFLGKYETPNPVKVAFFSAESGCQDIQRRFRAVASSKGSTNLDNLYISFAKPRLSDSNHLAAIAEFCTERSVQVLVVDPLYLTLCLGSGKTQRSASSLYDMGEVLREIADTCIANSITPILVHHFKKTTPEGDLNLNNFTFVGPAEFARQSILIGRREPYTSMKTNKMVMQIHGSERGEQLHVDIDEDTWQVKISTPSEAKRTEYKSRFDKLLKQLVDYLDLKPDSTKRGIRMAIKCSNDTITDLLDHAVEIGYVVGDSGTPQTFRLNTKLEAALAE